EGSGLFGTGLTIVIFVIFNLLFSPWKGRGGGGGKGLASAESCTPRVADAPTASSELDLKNCRRSIRTPNLEWEIGGQPNRFLTYGRVN
ncbi:MAG: hypothetical protein L0338_02590, partial [Acidobacteria bacterium]|nr:hypothetical protein [Acidobacteriota bacterium]